MTCSNLRRGAGVLLLTGVLAFPVGAAAYPAGATRPAAGESLSGFALFWDFLVSLFEGDEGTASDNSGTGGGTDNSGGAMDPNGCPKCTPAPPPDPEDTP